jgi:hypothetical protein
MLLLLRQNGMPVSVAQHLQSQQLHCAMHWACSRQESGHAGLTSGHGCFTSSCALLVPLDEYNIAKLSIEWPHVTLDLGCLQGKFALKAYGVVFQLGRVTVRPPLSAHLWG